MDDVVLMKVIQSTEQLLHDFADELLSIIGLLIYVVQNGASLTELGHYIIKLIIVVELINLDDVGMIQL